MFDLQFYPWLSPAGAVAVGRNKWCILLYAMEAKANECMQVYECVFLVKGILDPVTVLNMFSLFSTIRPLSSNMGL